MAKNISNPDGSDELRNFEPSRQPASQNGDFAISFFAEAFARFQRVIGSTRDVDLANALGISQQSVYGAKSRHKIPDSWYSIIADKYGASSDWLRTGDGAMTRSGDAADSQTHTAPAQPTIYNDMDAEEFNMGEILAKTIDILNSKTVYTTAIVSNINAFHEAISTKKQIDDMQAQLNQALGAFQGQLDQVKAESQQIKAENAQLRQELESCRVQDDLEHTG